MLLGGIPIIGHPHPYGGFYLRGMAFPRGLTQTRRFCFAVQRAKCFRSPHDGPASRRGGGSRARWQFAASGLFYCLSPSMNTRPPLLVMPATGRQIR
ncbi:hypothetical protein CEE59_00400 [Stenotrophomonas maltophilia]|nr:hypothetical protein CEE59_00400 [Stenotrophomonas maltophilia]